VDITASDLDGLDLNSLDGGVKGEGKTDEDTAATGGRGAGSFRRETVLDFVLCVKALSTKNGGIT
jgi:hypothetical protein